MNKRKAIVPKPAACTIPQVLSKLSVQDRATTLREAVVQEGEKRLKSFEQAKVELQHFMRTHPGVLKDFNF